MANATFSAFSIQFCQECGGGGVAGLGGGFKTALRAGGVAEHVVKQAEVVARQKAAGAAHAFVAVGLAEREAALKTLPDLRHGGDVFRGVVADEVHVENAAREMKIREVGEAFFRLGNRFQSNFKS